MTMNMTTQTDCIVFCFKKFGRRSGVGKFKIKIFDYVQNTPLPLPWRADSGSWMNIGGLEGTFVRPFELLKLMFFTVQPYLSMSQCFFSWPNYSRVLI